MKTIIGLVLCMLVATIAADRYDRWGVGGFDGIGDIGGIDGIGGIGDTFVDNLVVGGGIGIGSTYCPSSYCLSGQCSRLVRYSYFLGRPCYCSCGGY